MGKKVKVRKKRTTKQSEALPSRELKEVEGLPPDLFQRLNADLKAAASTMSSPEARFLVDYYYQSQEQRKRAANQRRAHEQSQEPNLVLDWMAGCTRRLESAVKLALKHYTEGQFVGQWMISLYGVGPVLAAGFLAHLDVTKAKGAGAFWRFAGLDPTQKWEKNTKRPWNAALKVLAWKFADVQFRFKNRSESYYGPILDKRWERLKEQNVQGKFQEAAAAALAEKKIGKDTEAYQAYIRGVLPPAHVLARAKRWVAKLFLSHLFDLMYAHQYKKMPPDPYAFSILGHHTDHKMYPPKFETWVEKALKHENE